MHRSFSRQLVAGLLFFSLLLSACASDLSLEPENNPNLPFSSLPNEVQEVYIRYQREAERPGSEIIWDESWKQVTTDSTVDFRQKHTTIEDGLALLTRGFNHHFYVEGKHFVLAANKGEPFVLHEGRLYYSLDLNLHTPKSNRAQDTTFVRVDLRSALPGT